MVAVVNPLSSTTVEEAHAFLGRLFGDLQPWTAGRFLNFMGHGGNADRGRVRTAYDPRDHERLRALKALYDPRNTLRANYNIPTVG